MERQENIRKDNKRQGIIKDENKKEGSDDILKMHSTPPVCSWEMQTVGRDEIISFSAGGGPVLSNCPNN